jgi:hypothetical protein
VSETLGEQMLASATEAVNAVCTWAHDQPMADFDARDERVLNVGRELLGTWLGQLASAAGSRTLNWRCGTAHIPRVPIRGRHPRH